MSRPGLLLISPFPAEPLYGGAVVRIHHLHQALSRRHEVLFVARGSDPGPRSRLGVFVAPPLVVRLYPYACID